MHPPSSIIRQPLHLTRQLVHHPRHLLLEFSNATRSALNMLHQPAESPERRATSVETSVALVYLVRMRRAPKVRVQSGQLRELPVAEDTLVGAPIPGLTCRPLFRDLTVAPPVRAIAILDESPSVGDEATTVHPGHCIVDALTRDARRACPGLEMQDEIGMRGEGLAAPASGARLRLRHVNVRAEVAVQVRLAGEDAVARSTEPVLLPVMLVQAFLEVENLESTLAVMRNCKRSHTHIYTLLQIRQ